MSLRRCSSRPCSARGQSIQARVRVSMELIERLGDVLKASGFAGQRARDLLADSGVVPPAASLMALNRPEDARLAVLLALFGYDGAVGRSEAQLALDPLPLTELHDAGLIEIDGLSVRSRVRLSDHDGLILAGDPRSHARKKTYVMPLSHASRFVARLTVRRRVESALDLGTGSGIQALLATRHADRVVGVDSNEHALAAARLSQRLNGIDDGVNWIAGNWLEQVPGQRFDLVIANPPYVISPDNVLAYRDSSSGDDELSRQIVRECAQALAEGGFATVMCNWIHPEGGWDAPLRSWLSGLECDALLLHNASRDPLAYATVWNQGLAEADQLEFDETVNRWVVHYQRRGIQRIATGFVILRRRSGGENWIQAFGDVLMPRGDGGEHLERMFAAGDLLNSCSGARQLGALLSRAWRLLDGHRLDQSAAFDNGVYAGLGHMRQQDDMGVRAVIDPSVLPVLLGCDGRRSLGELIEASAVPGGLERGAFHGLCLDTARDLIARGYLVAA